MSQKGHTRSTFSGKLGFVLSAAGASVGLGNIWRFPYLAAKYGGGIFLLVYILLAMTFGYTMIVAETSLGRMTGKSPVGAFKSFGTSGWLRFGGWINAIIPILIVPYYSVIGGWVVKYLADYALGRSSALAADGYFSAFISNGVPAEVCFVVFAALTLTIIFAGVENGIERVSKFMMPVLVVLSVIIAVYSVTRPGALEGVKYFLVPNLAHFSWMTVVTAMGQMFYSLSIAMGILITFGSYMKKDISIEGSTRNVEVFDTAIAIMAGLMIIPAVFAFSGGDPDALKAGPSHEPTAAALAYGIDKEQSQKIMVYDLGGGTFDVSILDISSGVIEVLATAGNNHLGGDDFDQCIVDYLVSEFKKQTKIDLTRDPAAMQRVREAAEKAKIELSSMTQTTVEQPYIAVGKQGPLHMEIPLTRAKFNDLTYHLVQATREPVNQAINDSGVSISQISKVLMVGGSSRIPAVQDLVQSMTGSLPFKGINPDECVAMGACLQAGVLSGSVKGLLLLDVTPLSLGIETLGGVCTRIIERNTTLPIRKSQIFTTASSFQSSVDIHVLQGERPMAHQNKELGRFQLTGIRRAPRGVPQIEVTFSIDANGIVNVSAKDLDTGKAQQITITASSNMSREDIDRAVRDAQRYAAEDAKLKAEATARDRCEQMIFQAGNAKNISKEDKTRLAEAVKTARRAVKSKDPAQMNGAADQLEALLNEAGVHIDPNAEYHGSARYENPNNDFTDNAVDAEFEEMN